MLVTDYIKEKNKILREEFGIDFDLVPEDQIKEVPARKLSTEFSTDMCPYCAVFGDNRFFENDCRGCPMKEEGNRCGVDYGNTWDKFLNFMIEVYSENDYFNVYSGNHRIVDLIEKFNSELEE